MQRLGCLAIVLTAACGSGTSTGAASLSGLTTTVKAAASEPFIGPDAAGNMVHGWSILLYENEAGGDCLEGTVLAKIGIFTNMKESDGPQGLLSTGGISIVKDSPPNVAGNAAANMTADGISSVESGQVNITEFHLTPDAKHADRIKGSVTAGAFLPDMVGVQLDGSFDAPICTEN
jgi:hypothetical protein